MGKAITAVVIVVVLALAGLGYYMYGHPSDTTPVEAVATTTVHFVIATTSTPIAAHVTPSIPNTGTDSTVAPAPKPKPAQTASAVRAIYPNAYHNSVYGLTVPGSYNVTQTQTAYAGVPDSASLNFYQGGALAFTINIFAKEQWNNIRIQETMNNDAALSTGGSTYYGEGTYLGENFNWIYSVIPVTYSPPTSVTFY